MSDVHIRTFEVKDRAAVRRISCETSFFERDRKLFIDDDEILADALTIYFTDYEPESCFVAEADDKVIGYIIGTRDSVGMEKSFSRQILPTLLMKAVRRGLLMKAKERRFFIHVIASALKGEFHAPRFSKEYPAKLHINIDKEYRGRKLGQRLIMHYMDFLNKHAVKGIHLSTMSEGAKNFFLKTGFQLLYESKRSYLKYQTGKTVPFYILGKKLGDGL